MQILRERRGMSREVLAGLVGMPVDWVKQVENGRIQAPGIDTVLRAAEALRVRDLADLTGRGDMPAPLLQGPGHPRLAAVRAAVDALPIGSAVPVPVRAKHLAARLAVAWRSRHEAPNHREILGALLPDLIRDVQLAVQHAQAPAEWRAAQAVLSEVYSLAQFFLAYQPDPSLLWPVAERGTVAAAQSGDPHAIGVSAWLMARRTGTRGSTTPPTRSPCRL
ncbi:helix-turn-helix transcriptional regulator, partial [Streptomyces sp. NPDC026092]|uniref:helix-turn-helix domain-containing protein n=1 Tax=Streptomyces sp. NPDC026092 TaxID=3154797 RepID=UPI0033F2EFDE